MKTAYKFTNTMGEYPEIGTPDVRKRIADELRNAREFNEASLDQIRSITKINNVYLNNIEEGNWSFLPPVYVKLFIKAYAEAVGIQSDEFNGLLDNAFESIKPKIQMKESLEEFHSQKSGAKYTKPTSVFTWTERNRSIIFYSIITVIAIVIIGWYLLKPPSEDVTLIEPDYSADIQTDTIAMDTTALSEKVEEEPRVEIQEPEFEEETIEEPVIDTFSFYAVSLGTCYVKIEHEDTLLYERTLWDGNYISEEYPEPIKVTLGNAPQLRIIVNGDSIEAFEGRKVRVLQINSEGIIR